MVWTFQNGFWVHKWQGQAPAKIETTTNLPEIKAKAAITVNTKATSVSPLDRVIWSADPLDLPCIPFSSTPWRPFEVGPWPLVALLKQPWTVPTIHVKAKMRKKSTMSSVDPWRLDSSSSVGSEKARLARLIVPLVVASHDDFGDWGSFWTEGSGTENGSHK